MTQLELATPVPILQRDEEFNELLDMYIDRQPKRVLEVGTYHGGTLFHWLQNAEPGTHVVSLDSYATEIDNRALYDEWIPPGVELDAVEGVSSHPAVVAFVRRFGPYDWVFIDAGHMYEEVKSDWLNYGSMCAAGGLVCFHDILYSGVAALWAEITAEHETTELISDPSTEWHGIGCVFM